MTRITASGSSLSRFAWQEIAIVEMLWKLRADLIFSSRIDGCEHPDGKLQRSLFAK